jgi:hypothetical protein
MWQHKCLFDKICKFVLKLILFLLLENSSNRARIFRADTFSSGRKEPLKRRRPGGTGSMILISFFRGLMRPRDRKLQGLF